MVRNVDVELLTKNIKEMCIQANHYLAPDMEKAMREACEKESKPLAKQILGQLLENLDIAGKDMIPICQDTGMAVVFLKIGHFLDHRIHTAVAKRSAAGHNIADTLLECNHVIPVIFKEITVDAEKFVEIFLVSIIQRLHIYAHNLSDLIHRYIMFIQWQPVRLLIHGSLNNISIIRFKHLMVSSLLSDM